MVSHRKGESGLKIRKMAFCALFSAFLCICAWLSFPLGDGAVTLQTFGIFLCLGVLGGKWGTLSIFVYLLLGAMGAPVFSGFRGGFGALLGTTGGYLTGFLLCGLIYWLITCFFPRQTLPAMLAGLLACYLFGSAWYYFAYARGGIALIVLKCVLPYLLPDIAKLLLASHLAKKLKRFVY